MDENQVKIKLERIKEMAQPFVGEALGDLPCLEFSISALVILLSFGESKLTSASCEKSKERFKAAINLQYGMYRSYCEITGATPKSIEQIISETNPKNIFEY